MTAEEFKALSKKAYDYLNAQQESAKTDFKLGTYERWDWNQDTGQLVWSDGGVAKVIADIQFVGSTSSKSKTWLWSWDNPTVSKSISNDMLEVRRYGETHRVTKLTEALWAADEVDGWEMTAIAAFVLQSKGAYRTSDEDGFTYMVFSNIRFANDAVLDKK